MRFGAWCDGDQHRVGTRAGATGTRGGDQGWGGWFGDAKGEGGAGSWREDGRGLWVVVRVRAVRVMVVVVVVVVVASVMVVA